MIMRLSVICFVELTILSFREVMMGKVVYDTKKRDKLLDSIEAGGSAAGEHVCPSCKLAMVDDRFERCLACQRKWSKVYESCFAHGWPHCYAVLRADDFYPHR